MPFNADEILKNVKVPLGGDLLGRERITGAKKTSLGCDSAAERFESIVETPALWHAKQSFLGVSFLIINNLRKESTSHGLSKATFFASWAPLVIIKLC